MSSTKADKTRSCIELKYFALGVCIELKSGVVRCASS
jgi:hypothetical protein